MEHYFWFALRSVPLIGNLTFRKLVERFGSPEKVMKARPDELKAKGFSPAIATAVSNHRYSESAEREAKAVEKNNARVIDFLSPEYPQLLLEIPDPPPFLYLKGSLENITPAIAVVGSRRATPYGLQTTTRMATELAEQRVAVISGMARGVDAAAHKGALAASGKTVGVLGCGIDVVYPSENRSLFQEMAEKGALVSEFSMGTPPVAVNFPRRNRIISGLSQGVLVVEAAEKSGSLITAQFALDQGREVFAIPGAINSVASRGTNRLIKQGAKLVESVADILEEFSDSGMRRIIPQQQELMLDPLEQTVYSLLAEGPIHIDEIAVKGKLTVQELSVMLLRLELKGVILQMPGKMFALA